MSSSVRPSPSRTRRVLHTVAALALPGTALALVGLTAGAAQAANPAGRCTLAGSVFNCTLNYGFTGGEQTFAVPDAVTSVAVDSPAAAAGVRPGDLVVELAGRPVACIGDLQRLLTSDQIGRPARVTLVRDGRVVTVEITPAALE